MFTIVCLIAFLAFVSARLSLAGYPRPPLAVAVFLLSIAELLRCLPLR